MVGKRHAFEEISAKLTQADELAAKGKTQREIAKTLGVSIMTLHRWKKAAKPPEASFYRGHLETSHLETSHLGVTNGATEHLAREGGGTNPSETIKRLEHENAQLRRLVTDTLLEKMKIEDELSALQNSRPRRSNGRE
jgi:putative transposase